MAQSLEWFKPLFPNRREAMARASETGVYTMQEIRGYFGLHYATVSRAVRWPESQRVIS